MGLIWWPLFGISTIDYTLYWFQSLNLFVSRRKQKASIKVTQMARSSFPIYSVDKSKLSYNTIYGYRQQYSHNDRVTLANRYIKSGSISIVSKGKEEGRSKKA
ncbi:hypothetical protein [Dapis sp. BLCC M126]|uniref:hypothetical protein n=1 Tax=Dapis sp. BLCC M126 TaxID=3400189 RepID=UPI003CEDE668